MKKLKYIFLIIILLFCVPKQSKAIDISGMLPGTMIMGSSKIEWRICKIRRIFCGKVAVIVITISVFTIGFLMVIGKLNWPMSLLMIFGCLIFYYAPQVANAMQHASGRAFVIFNPMCDCRCMMGLDQDNADDVIKAFVSVGEYQYLKNLANNFTQENSMANCIPSYGGLPGALIP
jgi:type IV secretory pathway VirB2 component (pilin)